MAEEGFHYRPKQCGAISYHMITYNMSIVAVWKRAGLFPVTPVRLNLCYAKISINHSLDNTEKTPITCFKESTRQHCVESKGALFVHASDKCSHLDYKQSSSSIRPFCAYNYYYCGHVKEQLVGYQSMLANPIRIKPCNFLSLILPLLI